MSKHRRKPRGQIVVVYTIALVALLGAVALCTDVAILYFNWSQLQKAADAAAIAGAHYLPTDTNTASSTAKDYAAKNGVTSSDIMSVKFNTPTDTTITVKLQRKVGLFFARVFNFLSAPVTVQATAEIQNAGGVGGLLPIGLACNTSSPGSCGMCQQASAGAYYTWVCQLKYGQLSSSSGNWEPLALGANGANAYRNSIENGYSGDLYINSDVNVTTEPGNMMGPTIQGFNERLQQSGYPNGGPGSVGGPDAPPTSSPAPMDSRLVIVPMVKYTGNGKSSVPIESFALMWIGSVSSDGTINGYFLKQASTPDALFPNPTAPPTGLYGVSLIK